MPTEFQGVAMEDIQAGQVVIAEVSDTGLLHVRIANFKDE